MKQARDLNWLQAEKQRLKQECKAREEKMNESFLYLQKNAGEIILEIVLPFNHEQFEKTSGTFDFINGLLAGIIPGIGDDKNSRKRKIIKFAQMIVSGIVFKYMKNWTGKKTDEKKD